MYDAVGKYSTLIFQHFYNRKANISRARIYAENKSHALDSREKKKEKRENIWIIRGDAPG